MSYPCSDRRLSTCTGRSQFTLFIASERTNDIRPCTRFEHWPVLHCLTCRLLVVNVTWRLFFSQQRTSFKIYFSELHLRHWDFLCISIQLRRSSDSHPVCALGAYNSGLIIFQILNWPQAFFYSSKFCKEY